MVRLFIENIEIELTEDIQVAITRQFEDLSNPTTIINDWSKTVSIPFTAKNNETFGHIYNPDKIIVDGGTVGVYFNPLLKLNFRLEWNSNVIMQGYAKMNEVKQINGNGTYEITLFGELGKVFQEMKKITFDNSTDDTNYLIDGSQYVSEYINKDLVYSSWTSSGQTTPVLKKKTDSGYSVTDIIGFAPNNAFSEGFDYKSFQTSTRESVLFKDWIEDNLNFKQDVGVDVDTIIPDGFLPREWAEYRSYLQLPFIYWNKLFQIFQKKAETITGYQFELDSEWFNADNIYWNDLVYMLSSLNLKQEESVTNYYKFGAFTLDWGSDIQEYTEETETDLFLRKVEEIIPIVDANEEWIDLANNYNVVFNTFFNIDLRIPTQENNLRLNPNNGLQFSIAVLNENNVQVDEYKYLLVDTEYTGSTDGYEEVIRVERGGSGGWYDMLPKLSMSLNRGKYNTEKVKLMFKAVWLNSNLPYYDSNNNPYLPQVGWTYLNIYSSPQNLPTPCVVIKNVHRSYSHFELNDLWNNEFNLFDEILKYCKMYRIGIFVNDISKKIIFKTYKNFFSDKNIKDWTNKVDKSKDFVITPVTFDNKYVLFNYDDNDTQIRKEYNEKYGLNFGSYRLITDYNFNDTTKNLFEHVKPSIVNTDNVLNFYKLTQKEIIYSFPSEIYVTNKNEDKKAVDLFGTFYFHNGLGDFELNTDLHMKYPFISDDTNWQAYNNTYMYNAGSSMNAESVTTYPKLDIVKDTNLCVFTTPKENYTYLSNYEDTKGIYYNLWQKYLNERYNIQNKKITCYVRLSPLDYYNFDFNKFVVIGNQLCMVNKIYDYNITSVEPTKVDLITIQDISGYDSFNYEMEYIPTDCIMFVANENSEFSLIKKCSNETLEYKTDSTSWAALTTGTTVSLSRGNRLYVRGKKTGNSNNNNNYTQFGISGDMSVIGNINTLLNYETPDIALKQYNYAYLFRDCTGLTNANKLELPAITLNTGCYYGMFNGCANLTTTPTLPGTTSAGSCYYGMFSGCTSITTAPDIKLTTMKTSSCHSMFKGCTSLTTAPSISATELYTTCYQSMFEDCTSLTTMPNLPVTSLVNGCYQRMFKGCTSLVNVMAELPATVLATNCYSEMFRNCTSLTTAPEIKATSLEAGGQHYMSYMFMGCTSLTTAPSKIDIDEIVGASCIREMFRDCTSLTKSPDILATKLSSASNQNSMYRMFYGCTNLNSVKCLLKDVNYTNNLTGWMTGVQTVSGTFTKNADATFWSTGTNGIPTNWTVVNYQVVE